MANPEGGQFKEMKVSFVQSWMSRCGVAMTRAMLCILVVMAQSAIAQGGDAAAGKRLTVTCTACHAQASTASVPNIGGQDPKYFVAAMRAYQDGIRSHATMRDVVRVFSERDFRNLAAYYAELGIAGDAASDSTAPQNVQPCFACHGVNGKEPVTPDTPKLAGQKRAFIETVLKEYKAGTRKNSIMEQQASAMSDDDIAGAAAFFSSQKALAAR